MSILLDALKKSEDERANRRAGEPLYAGQAAVSGARNALPLIAALVFGGIAVGLAAWVFLGGNVGGKPSANSSAANTPRVPEVIAAAPAPVPAVPIAQTQTPLPSVAPETPAAATTAPPTTATPPKPAAAYAERSLYGSTGNASSSAPSTPIAASPPDKPKPLPPPPTTATATTANTNAIKPAASAPTNTPLKSNTDSSTKAPADKEPKPAASAPASIAKPNTNSSEVLAFNDLPAELKAELPALRLSGYMHADDANDRLIAINDKLVRVGDEAAPGVRVQSISAAAVVFAYKGYRFRIAQ